MTTSDDIFQWWASLKADGLLISAAHLAAHFDGDRGEGPLDDYVEKRLRKEITAVLDADKSRVSNLLDVVFEDLLGYPRGQWSKGPNVGTEWSQTMITGDTVRPNRVWQDGRGATLPVFVANRNLGIVTDDWTEKTLGRGRSKRAVSKVLEWMRKQDLPLAILTNGRQLRLLHAGVDYQAWREWDIELWFQGGEPGPQLVALRKLLGVEVLEKPSKDEKSILLRAIEDTRSGQADVSDVLGERVRLAVEKLIEHADSDGLDELYFDGDVDNQDIYIAACRMMMRCVVILFAEARELLPVDYTLYHASYSLSGLRKQLESRSGGRPEELRHSFNTWPRILALFNLVYHGSAHSELTVPEYGGDLFRPGNPDADDPILRALAVFENPASDVSDAVVFRILNLLTRSRTKVRIGRKNTYVNAPVDFSDLSTEYIGIIYEGLLDFQLERVDEGDPMVFLNIGDEPILPFDRLDQMTPKELADVFGELAEGSRTTPRLQTDLKEVGLDENDDIYTEDARPDDRPPPQEGNVVDREFTERQYRERIYEWARRAVADGGIVSTPKEDKGKEPEAWTDDFKHDCEAAAKKLVPRDRIYMPGDWYLVRWGGTRKGSGTFYTRPQLAFPTVRRTLEPLTHYDAEHDERRDRAPKRPEEILELKVCDPAMGSGSFLIAALRYLTDVLYDALHYHERIEESPDGEFPEKVRLADGLVIEDLADEPLPVPQERADFEERLKSRLKRYIVERCIYGVDLDPLAVELGKMALWIETMDPRLPFGFLDHKLRCGNSLVGCWFDQVHDYPAVAFERSSWDGGDKGHKNGVHFDDDQIGPALKEVRNELVKFGLRRVIRAGAKSAFDFMEEDVQPFDVHDDIFTVLEKIHDLEVHESSEKERLYREEIRDNPAYQRLRRQLDTWCAIWFWPFDEILKTARAIEALKDDSDPEITTDKGILQDEPTQMLSERSSLPLPADWLDLDGRQHQIVEGLRQQHRFFHWELEFPDVFNPERSGFDAVVGNPPWEIEKPNSKEFFSNVDPLYRSYGKQEALEKQTEYFTDIDDLERDWIDYNAGYKALSNWCKNRAHPFGDEKFTDHDGVRFNLMDHGYHWRQSDELHKMWLQKREGRTGYADTAHPFQYQGSADTNSYKLFLELAHALLHRDEENRGGGRMGFIVPSGIYTDKGCTELRTLFIEDCSWQWLFGFENRNKIFDIDSRFKFCPVIIENAGQTETIHTAFMHRDLDDWERAEEHVIDYSTEKLERLSPNTLAFYEITNPHDDRVLTQIFDSGFLLRDKWDNGYSFTREFDKTNDSKLFLSRSELESKGLILPDEDIRNRLVRRRLRSDGWVPVWEGKNCRFEKWVSEPEFFVTTNDAKPYLHGVFPFGVRRIGRNTDKRTLVGCLIPPFTPTMYTIEVCRNLPKNLAQCLYICITSFVLDYVARFQITTSVALENIKSLPLPSAELSFLTDPAARLLQKHDCAKQYISARIVADVAAGQAYGLSYEDMKWVLKDCDLPPTQMANKSFHHDFDAKGFWRVDKDKDPELRHTVLTQVAFRDLQTLIDACNGDQERAIQIFAGTTDPDEAADVERITANVPHIHPTDGWMLPKTLRLADYDLGHDDRAQQPQPVASRLGPRFFDWQLQQDPAESWQECERHAELLEQIVPTPDATEANTATDEDNEAQGQLL